ncbi:hypothetical protein ACQ86N_13825 [Puia sp. P3]|uniref:hypothetical protein n=1 Tax=Puia sp. P3 TaxID=3423952 RepID=UPI003D6706A3
MINMIKRMPAFALSMALLCSCSKQNGFGPNYSAYNGGDVPISVQNAVGFRPDPTVTASVNGDSSITVNMVLASTTGRTIREITKVATSSSYAAIQSTGTTGFFRCPSFPAAETR